MIEKLDDATDGGGIKNGNNLKHVGQQHAVEKVGVALLEAIEVDIFFETGGLATKLSKDALTVVSAEEIRGQTSNVGKRHFLVGQRDKEEGKKDVGEENRMGVYI